VQRLALPGDLDFHELSSCATTLSEDQVLLNEHVCRQFKHSTSNLPKKKEAASNLLRRLATLVLRAQRAPYEMLALATPDRLASAPAALADLFISTIRQEERAYSCFLAVSGPRSDLQALVRETPDRKTGFRLVNKDYTPQDETATAFFDNMGRARADVSFVTAVSSDISPIAASKTAVRRLRPILDIFNMYQNTQSLVLLDTVLVREPSKSHVIDLSDSSLRRLKPRKNARRLTFEILERISHERLDGSILNALEHYALAHSSAAARVRLVNLWSGLECLVGTRTSESIISAVCDSVAPIIAWRQVDRLVRYQAICLQEFRARLQEDGLAEKSLLGEGFASERENHISPESVLLVLTKPDKHPHIMNLLGHTSRHPLLCHRTYELWKTFHDPKVLRRDLLAYHSRVRWNLCRFYRSRNLIVHQGEETPLIENQLETLHYYFSLTLSRILHDMRLHPHWTIRDALAHWRLRWGYLSERLEKSPQTLLLGDFLPEPIRLKSSPVWSTTKPAGN